MAAMMSSGTMQIMLAEYVRKREEAALKKMFTKHVKKELRPVIDYIAGNLYEDWISKKYLRMAFRQDEKGGGEYMVGVRLKEPFYVERTKHKRV